MLSGLLRANSSLHRLTLRSVVAEHVDVLAEALQVRSPAFPRLLLSDLLCPSLTVSALLCPSPTFSDSVLHSAGLGQTPNGQVFRYAASGHARPKGGSRRLDPFHTHLLHPYTGAPP